MRPIKLEIENFTVYKGKHFIDFTPLNFFVIKGKNGSGKSSLIEAICYALYGKVPRYGNSKAHKDLLSKGEDWIFVSLDFSVKGKCYRIEREYNKKNDQSDFRFYEFNEKGIVPKNFREDELETFLLNLIKLDYRIFTRVVFLTQNQFEKFLKANEKEDRSKKREILNSLLGLSDILSSMKNIIKEKHKEIKKRLEFIKFSLEGLCCVVYESLNQLEDQINKMEENYKEFHTAESLESLRKKIYQTEELFGKLKQKWEEIKKKLKKKEELNREYDELSYEFNLYETLKNDLDDNKFPEYLSSHYLEILKERANYYLREFSIERLQFKISGDELHIIDCNTNYERRVHSLSGGETFLASLSLAFALSDLLSKDAPIESIFIDEGFGSLDKETRENVIKFLNLIKENTNKMIGIITHMEDIANLFDQRIELHKKKGASSIKVIF